MMPMRPCRLSRRRRLRSFRDDFAEGREQLAQVSALLLGLMQALEETRELSGGNGPALGHVSGQSVDPLPEPEALGVELEGTGVALGQSRLHVAATGEAAVRGDRIDQRTDTLQEIPVVGHQEPIICRPRVEGLWVVRPIFFVAWS
jgi:hypothetical protein